MVELFDSLAGHTRFTHFCAVFNCTLQQTMEEPSAFVQFGDSRSNRSRDVRAAHFLMDDERTNDYDADEHRSSHRAELHIY